MRHLHIERHYVNRAFPGDRVTVKVIVRNTSWLPIPWLEVHESLPVALASPPSQRQVLSIGAHATADLQYTLHCNQRGYYELGPLTAQTGDLLGLFSPSRIEVRSEPLIVYPRVLPLERLGLPTRAPHVQLLAPSALFEDPARIMGIRDYEPGDPLRRIHWTATAARGKLAVKQYQPAIARETLICLDLDRNDYGRRQVYTATELAIVAAASLATHIITVEKLPTGFATAAHDPLTGDKGSPPVRFYLPPRSERSHLMNILEVLARIEVSEDTGFLNLLHHESTKLAWGSTITVITGKESEELHDTLARLRRAGFAVSLILIQPAYTPAHVRSRARLLGIPVHRIWRERDFSETWRIRSSEPFR